MSNSVYGKLIYIFPIPTSGEKLRIDRQVRSVKSGY